MLSYAVFPGHKCPLLVLVAGLLAPMAIHSQNVGAVRRTQTSFLVSVKVEPVFRVLDVHPIAGGNEYRIWTNLKSVRLADREYRVSHAGESTLVMPGPRIELYGALPGLRTVHAVRHDDDKATVVVNVDY